MTSSVELNKLVFTKVNIMADNDEEMDIDNIDEEPEVELLDRKDFLENFEEDSNPIAEMKWVFQALGAKDLIASDAPSAGAWFLLQSLKSDHTLLKSFYTTFCTKLMPNKSDMDKDDARSNDKRERLGLIERLLLEPDDDAPVLSITERRARELAVSTTDSQASI